MAIRGVIFDLGHTLMHLDGTWPEMFARGAADLAAYVSGLGLGLDGEAVAQAWLAHRQEGFAQAKATDREVLAEATMRRTLAQFGLSEPSPALVAAAVDAFFAYEDARWYAEPDAVGVLRELAGRGLRLGAFSNATHDPFIQRLVDRLGFRPWLDPALTSAATGIRKPDPAAFAPFLAAWELPAGEVAMVGDTFEADIVGAQRAGLRAVWIPVRDDANQEGAAAADSSLQPDATLQRLADLPACLSALNSS
jgi:putative hydrolase of the HAD superfamily